MLSQYATSYYNPDRELYLFGTKLFTVLAIVTILILIG